MDLDRRQLLKLLGGGATGLGAATATNNVLLGYGEFGNGENLLTQDLSTAVVEHLGTAPLPDSFRIEGLPADSFFDRLSDVETAPEIVEPLRGDGFTTVQPSVIKEFTGALPSDSEGVVRGLVEGFRSHTHYDVPRYIAGAIQDNILFGRVELRKRFRDDVSFEALLAADDARGMFCYEYSWRAAEALHAVSAHDQSPPVFAGWVLDARHKHAYTVIASAYWEDEELVLPVTFVDYTHTTLYDDVRMRGILGEGLNAYNERHRATDIWWTV